MCFERPVSRAVMPISSYILLTHAVDCAICYVSILSGSICLSPIFCCLFSSTPRLLFGNFQLFQHTFQKIPWYCFGFVPSGDIDLTVESRDITFLFNPPPLITHASPVTKRKQVRDLADPVCLHGFVVALSKGVRKAEIYWSAFLCCNVCKRARIRDSGIKIVCTWPKWVLHLDTVLLFAVGHRLERSCGSSFVIGGSDYFC